MVQPRAAGRGRSLAELLAAQSSALRRKPAFAELERLLAGSAALRRARLPPVACRLLDEPRLEPRFLGDFLATYRLPESPFFAIFLGLKRGRRAELDRARVRRKSQIEGIAAAYPDWVRGCFAFLKGAESARNPGTPLWAKAVFPRSKKRAAELARFGPEEWLAYLFEKIELLRGGYRRIALPPAGLLLDCALLGLAPPRQGRVPAEAAVRSAFRLRSRSAHPDGGGEPGAFRALVAARDRLLEGGRRGAAAAFGRAPSSPGSRPRRGR
ncbi:MAG TPA: hypothetical protein PLB91_10235 [Spirochaetales bacterium]|nr:hypothetical protein [Spirochaetales bacterium]HRY54052.1 hypothetical protein [Spirochaetia bacterium]HRZ63432.1 hypothetical protein [Spirochaetia bacterium]